MGQSTKESNRNAFLQLMTAAASKNKRRRSSSKSSSSSRFVLCPAGCGKHVLPETINAHLDECIGTRKEDQTAATIPLETAADSSSQQEQQPGSQGVNITASTAASTPPDESYSEHVDMTQRSSLSCSQCSPSQTTYTTDSMTQATMTQVAPTPFTMTQSTTQELVTQPLAASQIDMSQSQATILASQQSVDSHSQSTSSSSQSLRTNNNNNKEPNLFTRMLQKSKQVFRTTPAPTITAPATIAQYFHLDAQGQVHLSCMEPPSEPTLRWTETVVLRNHGRPILVRLSSSLLANDNTGNNNNPQPQRLVRQHSKLSVPVLKSMLQKAIRRQRSLAAVTIAMELADKALGDLLRRLPIIILEDSTLHPDFALVVWLLMAESKGFVVTRTLLARVLQIIYQVAGCSWKDDEAAVMASPETASETSLDHLSLDGLGNSSWEVMGSSSSQMHVWSILARAEYGGMPCDVQMLHQCARTWSHRFASGALTKEQATRMNVNDSVKWAEVPTITHSSSIRDLSKQKVTELLSPQGGLAKLRLPHVCVEGVDFHCSPIVDQLLANHNQVVLICADMLRLSGESFGPHESRDRVERCVKQLMWKFSAGVNRRRSLVGHDSAVKEEVTASKERSAIWKELFESNARQYQVHYVKQRLV